MSMPVPDLSSIIPSKAKTWVALFGSALSFVVPFVLQSVDALPAPWPAVIGVVLFVLSALGVYKAPYKPAGTTLALDPAQGAVSSTTAGNVPVAVPAAEAPGEVLWSSQYKNPWKT